MRFQPGDRAVISDDAANSAGRPPKYQDWTPWRGEEVEIEGFIYHGRNGEAWYWVRHIPREDGHSYSELHQMRDRYLEAL